MTNNIDNNKDDLILNKLKNDLTYYQGLLQEIEQKRVIIHNEYEYLKKIYPNLIDDNQYFDYYNRYALVTNNLSELEYQKNNYSELISILENLIEQHDNKIKLQLGDILSISTDNNDDILAEIVKIDNQIYLIDIFTLENISKPFNSLEELNDLIENGKIKCSVYYIDNSKRTIPDENDVLNTEYKYLVHNDAMGYEYEVAITYDCEDNYYKIIDVGLNQYFTEEYFKTFEDAFITLHSDCSLVKRLRN